MDYDKIKEQLISDPEVRDRIARRAYELYVERRGRPGHPAEDWLRAEGEVLPGLMEEILRKNREVIEAHDSSDPLMVRAAEHMEEELRSEGTGAAASTAVGQMAAQSRESVWTKTGSDDMVPDAAAVAEKIAPPASKTPAGRAKAGSSASGTSGAKSSAKGAGAKGSAPKGVNASGTKSPAKSGAKGAAASSPKGSSAAKKSAAKPASKTAAKPASKPAPAKGSGKKAQGKK